MQQFMWYLCAIALLAGAMVGNKGISTVSPNLMLLICTFLICGAISGVRGNK